MREPGLFCLEKRRLRTHLIDVHKIMEGLDRVDNGKLILLMELSRTNSQKHQIKGKIIKNVLRKILFLNAVYD